MGLSHSYQRDERHPEDADTTANDHGPDALRYAAKVRPRFCL